MLRLHSHSSRSYPGRPVRSTTPAGAAPGMATCRGTGQESAEAIVGRGNKPGETEKTGKDLPCRRAEHREGKNLYDLS